MIITGGTRGLGLLQARSAMRAGANHVTITSRPSSLGGNAKDVDKAMKLLRKEGSNVDHVYADARRSCAPGKDDGKCNT